MSHRFYTSLCDTGHVGQGDPAPTPTSGHETPGVAPFSTKTGGTRR